MAIIFLISLISLAFAAQWEEDNFINYTCSSNLDDNSISSFFDYHCTTVVHEKIQSYDDAEQKCYNRNAYAECQVVQIKTLKDFGILADEICLKTTDNFYLGITRDSCTSPWLWQNYDKTTTVFDSDSADFILPNNNSECDKLNVAFIGGSISAVSSETFVPDYYICECYTPSYATFLSKNSTMASRPEHYKPPQCSALNDDICYVNNLYLYMSGDRSSFYVGKYGLRADDIQCTITSAAAFFYDTQILTWLSGIIFGLIIILSIYGKFKENYRWLILNQALWELYTTFEYVCLNPYRQKACMSINALPSIFLRSLFPRSSDSYSSLLLLSLSRFTCLYFSNTYEKLTSRYRIFLWIIGSYLFCTISNAVYNELMQIHFEEPPTIVYDYYNPDDYYTVEYSQPVLMHILHIFVIINFFKPAVFLLLSFICIVPVIYRIIVQSNYQRKHNKKDFYGTLRITIVLVFELTFNLILFFIELLMNGDVYSPYNASVFGFKIEEFVNEIGKSIPALNKRFGLCSKMNYQALRQLRVVTEGIIILSIMTGYRESIMYFYRWIKAKILKTEVVNLKSQRGADISNINSTTIVSTR